MEGRIHPGTAVMRFCFARSSRVSFLENDANQPGQDGHEWDQDVGLPAGRLNGGKFEGGLSADEAVDHERAEDGGGHDRAEKTAVQVTNYFLEHKGKCGQRGVEGGGEAGGGAGGGGGAPALLRLAEQPREIGGEPAGDIDARPLATKAAASTDCHGAGNEFDPDGPPRDEPEVLPECHLQLRYAAASRLLAVRVHEKP